MPRACGDADDVLHRHHGAEHVRHVRDGDDLGLGPEQALELVHEQLALVRHRDPLQHRTLALAVEVPRHDVGMMLHDGEHDLVALADLHAAVGRGHEVDGLGSVAGEDDLVDARGIEEAAHDLARVLEALRRGVREIVQAAVNVGVFEAIGVVHGLDHRQRLLGGGAVVEIDQRLAVDLAEQDREIGPELLDVVIVRRLVARFVELIACRNRHRVVLSRRLRYAALRALSRSSQRRAFSIRTPRRPSCATLSIASPMNDSTRSAMASSREIPRARK